MDAPVPVLFLSVDEAARALGLSRSTIKRMVANGQLRSTTAGRRRLIPVSGVNELSARLMSDAA